MKPTLAAALVESISRVELRDDGLAVTFGIESYHYCSLE
jgi:hypothetical protein